MMGSETPEDNECMYCIHWRFMEFFVGKVHGNIMLMNRITCCRFLGDFIIIIYLFVYRSGLGC